MTSACTRYQLFYRPDCPPCRRLSLTVVLLSGGAIERVAVDARLAEALYAAHPDWRGRLMLVHGARVWLGAAVFHAVPRALLARRLRPALRHALAGIRRWRPGHKRTSPERP